VAAGALGHHIMLRYLGIGAAGVVGVAVRVQRRDQIELQPTHDAQQPRRVPAAVDTRTRAGLLVDDEVDEIPRLRRPLENGPLQCLALLRRG
jgi:hypothetical protein